MKSESSSKASTLKSDELVRLYNECSLDDLLEDGPKTQAYLQAFRRLLHSGDRAAMDEFINRISATLQKARRAETDRSLVRRKPSK